MIKTIFQAAFLPLLAGFFFTPVFAETTPINLTTPSVANLKVQENAASRLAKIISQSDTAIAARLSALNDLNARVQALKNVSASEKTNISNEVTSNISDLTALKAKIDADTDVTVASTDSKTITGNYRIYALIMPQGYIAASADRVSNIASMMTVVAGKLQSRIAADQSAGKDVTSLQASLSDMNAKITDANSQATAAQVILTPLVPDQGNKTQMASNTAALKAARADIKTATKDLQDARKDAQSILKDLKALNVKVSATASTTAQ